MNRLDYIRRALNVRRYHQHTTLEIDTVGKHSAGVALYLLMLDPLCSKELLAHAITHDLSEFEVGDLPAPTKRNLSPTSRAELAQLEANKAAEIGFNYGIHLSPQEYALFKLCDYLDGFSFCIEEKCRGNRTMQQVGDTYMTYLPAYLNDHDSAPWYRAAQTIVNQLCKFWSLA